jgi:hypothetical protein
MACIRFLGGGLVGVVVVHFCFLVVVNGYVGWFVAI